MNRNPHYNPGDSPYIVNPQTDTARKDSQATYYEKKELADGSEVISTGRSKDSYGIGIMWGEKVQRMVLTVKDVDDLDSPRFEAIHGTADNQPVFDIRRIT